MKTLFILLLIGMLGCTATPDAGPESAYNLRFNQMAGSWDEGLPLGNGWLGALVWQNGDNLRFSLDRADLWDLRPVPELSLPEWNFKWVKERWEKNEYSKVQELFDYRAYDLAATPTKIPGAAIEFRSLGFKGDGKNELDLKSATAHATWPDGMKLETFVHATEPIGYFRFENIPGDLEVMLVPPVYQDQSQAAGIDVVGGQDLRRLGYTQGTVVVGDGKQVYRQEGALGFYYQVSVEYERSGTTLTGRWSISSSLSEKSGKPDASAITGNAPAYGAAVRSHTDWWNEFWSRSDISVPDTLIRRQWYMEQYKFGSAARADAPPISLQAVWTADNGKLPPWKGDFHNDLNTQLSYWPAYSANRLDLEIGYLNWLWDIMPVCEKYTRDYFGTGGLNVPGVATLLGEPMGGWIQYSFGPTVSAWLAQHFYLHWRYSLDREFLENRAYPYLKAVAQFLDEFSERDSAGRRKLPLSSSPEIHDNSPAAWFSQTTNYDLGLIRFTYEKVAELAAELGKEEEAARWKSILNEWPDLTYDSTGLNFAPGHPYRESHRHFSHLMAWHPLGLVDVSQGEESQEIISNTLKTLEKIGPGWWCGYSYSWLGNLYARNGDGEKAANALTDFARCFVLPNSFHVNGDQTKSGKSNFTYRPFTLEGNFAFASGVQEMLIQSHTGIIRVFPAVPDAWVNCSFRDLRTEGAFLVTAIRENGRTREVVIRSEKGGKCRLADPEDPARVLEYQVEPNGVIRWSVNSN